MVVECFELYDINIGVFGEDGVKVVDVGKGFNLNYDCCLVVFIVV